VETIMGIFDALNSAVAGLNAQSFALQNISGNIANSQTTAFKGTDTSFQDLIQQSAVGQQSSGSVMSNSRATNNVQGNISSSSIGTFMAINGDGFFVVEKPSSVVDGRPVFSSTNDYTRRGDFQLDKNGFLVNGAGYYLLGVPVDPTTGNLVGSAPQPLQFQNNLLPAQATTQVTYQANLASYPLTAAHNTNVPKSELINPGDFIANPLAGAPAAAKITGSGATLLPDAVASLTGTAALPNSLVNAGTFTINGSTVTLTAGMTQAQVVNAINTSNGGNPPAGMAAATLDASNHLILNSADARTAINIGGANPTLLTEVGLQVGTTNPTNLLTQGATGNLTITVGANPPLTVNFGTGGLPNVQTMADLSTRLSALTGGSASVDATGNISVTASNPTDTINISGSASPATFGMHTTTAMPANGTVIANDEQAFLNESIGGGAITAFDSSGAPVNIQLRWAKTASSLYGNTDTWNLFYQVNSSATGTQVAWQNVGVNYTFSPNGQMNPPIANVTLNNVVINGDSLGTIQLSHGTGGLTQFADPNGVARVTQLDQNGFAAGTLQSVSVNNQGRVVGSYSNGRTIDLADVTLATFNGENLLQSLDGGAFAATDGSGPAILGASGQVVGSSLEGANIDIADEFSKLIVTQQAYSANTRIITTANTMVQDLLNMIR
jgi:flagellar hook protein FlgE